MSNVWYLRLAIEEPYDPVGRILILQDRLCRAGIQSWRIDLPSYTLKAKGLEEPLVISQKGHNYRGPPDGSLWNPFMAGSPDTSSRGTEFVMCGFRMIFNEKPWGMKCLQWGSLGTSSLQSSQTFYGLLLGKAPNFRLINRISILGILLLLKTDTKRWRKRS